MTIPVTVQITREVDPDAAHEVEAWVARGQSLLRAFPGYLGSGWIRSTGTSQTWHMLLRFESDDTLQVWADSPERQAWMEEFSAFVRHQRHVKRSGIEGWFDDPRRETTEDDAAGAAPPPAPPRWKQVVVIFTGFFPVSLAANALIGWLFPVAPLVLKVLLVIMLATPTMVYWVLPWTTRMYQPWLARPPRGGRGRRRRGASAPPS